MRIALPDIRIIELVSGPAGSIPGMILADFGAEVVTINRAGDPLSELAATRMLARGKHGLDLDLDNGAELDRLHDLLGSADVLVTNWRAAALQRRRLDFERVRAAHPHLVYCRISGFGHKGPMADVPGYEHVVAAWLGRMNLYSGIVDRPGPVFSALQVGVHACAQSATAGILAVLLARAGDGCAGRLVETSVLQGLSAYEQGALIGEQLPERFGHLAGILEPNDAEPGLPRIHYHPVQAADGRWMQLGNLLPHLLDNFLTVTDLIDVVADPDFDPTQMGLPAEKLERFRNRMLLRMHERSAADWMSDFVDNGGVAATLYQTTRQALDDADITANGHVVESSDGGRQLGPVARLGRTPARPGGQCVNGTALAARWLATPRNGVARNPEKAAPLDGIRVVELATIIAAPLGASFLADMGAQVTKVEPVGGDPYRGLAGGLGASRTNAGKRSISIDLKSEQGRSAVMRLLEGADVLIHNFRPGVPEKLGIAYEQVRAVNPDIVYVQCNGYGPGGPGANRPSTHPIPGAALGGAVYQLGERLPGEKLELDKVRLWARRLARANDLNPDPNTAVVLCNAALLGLLSRRLNGAGQQVYVDMFGANAWANSDDFLSYPGKPQRRLPDEQLLGLGPAYRLYPCKDEQWVFLALVYPHERERFRAVLCGEGIELDDDIWQRPDSEIAGRLEAVFAARSADDWQSLFVKAEIGCVRADRRLPSERWLQGDQVRALDWLAPVTHPQWGPYRRHGSLVRFNGGNPDLKPPPYAGQHNEELLSEAGLSSDEIAGLAAAGILWKEQAV